MKFCHNCGSHFHKTKECSEPIISCGLIVLKLPYYQKLKATEYLKIDDYNFRNLKNINKISQYIDKIKFLLIRRKHSLNFIEFIRGKYQVNDKTHLANIFELMSPNEILLIATLEFKKLWENVWGVRSWLKSFEKEFSESELKFNTLKNNKELFKYLTEEIIPLYNSQEWGLPKGRRDNNESNLDCGIREFCEETSLIKNNITIAEKISPLTENFIGTNNKKYRSIFYLASINKIKYNFDIKKNPEIGDIGFFNLNECISLIRDYHQERIKILEKTFLFAINLIEKNKEIKQTSLICNKKKNFIEL